MNQYDLIVLDDLQGAFNETEGRTFVGNNFTYTGSSNFAIAMPTSTACSDRTVVVVGSIVAGSPLNVNHGSLAYGVSYGGRIVNFNGGTGCGLIKDATLSDATITANVTNASSALAGATPNNADPTVDGSGNLVFNVTTKDANGLAVFDVTAAQVFANASVTSLININNTANATTILINVSGTTVNWTQGQLGTFLASGSANIGKVIWNFHQATSISTNARRFAGAMLAPLANVNPASGNLEGSAVVKTLQETGEIHLPVFALTNTTPLTGGCGAPTNTPTATSVPASIGDLVWNDINGDGLQNDGAGRGINGVTLRLYRDNGNGAFEPGAGDTLVMTQTTAGDGGYLFTGLQPGAYWVDVDDASPALAGYTLINGLQSGPDPKLVTVNAGDNYTQADFGYAGKGLISGVVFYDWNSDSFQGPGEDPIPDTEVCLYKDNNRDGLLDGGDTQLTCMTTDSMGVYAFAGQVASAYLVVETQPAGLQNTTPNVLPVALVIVGPGGSAPDNNFGEIIYVRLGDMVYVDLNGNGVQDASETTGLAGVELQLTGMNIAGESVNWTTVTITNGHYLTDTLLPGAYTVKAPAQFGGFQLTSQASKTTALTTVITQDLTLDFGYIFPTGVGVYEFKAAAGRGQVTLSWLAFGPQPPSFYVQRADNSKGVGAAQVTAQPVTSGTGAYQFVDRGVVAGQTYWYTLEEANSGQLYGPLAVTVVPMSIRAFLPSVGR